eukprot:scaffold8708_cov54-Phaeocystis_antarctica.AAC.4
MCACRVLARMEGCLQGRGACIPEPEVVGGVVPGEGVDVPSVGRVPPLSPGTQPLAVRVVQRLADALAARHRAVRGRRRAPRDVVAYVERHVLGDEAPHAAALERAVIDAEVPPARDHRLAREAVGREVALA